MTNRKQKSTDLKKSNLKKDLYKAKYYTANNVATSQAIKPVVSRGFSTVPIQEKIKSSNENFEYLISIANKINTRRSDKAESSKDNLPEGNLSKGNLSEGNLSESNLSKSNLSITKAPTKINKGKTVFSPIVNIKAKKIENQEDNLTKLLNSINLEAILADKNKSQANKINKLEEVNHNLAIDQIEQGSFSKQVLVNLTNTNSSSKTFTQNNKEKLVLNITDSQDKEFTSNNNVDEQDSDSSISTLDFNIFKDVLSLQQKHKSYLTSSTIDHIKESRAKNSQNSTSQQTFSGLNEACTLLNSFNSKMMANEDVSFARIFTKTKDEFFKPEISTKDKASGLAEKTINLDDNLLTQFKSLSDVFNFSGDDFTETAKKSLELNKTLIVDYKNTNLRKQFKGSLKQQDIIEKAINVKVDINDFEVSDSTKSLKIDIESVVTSLKDLVDDNKLQEAIRKAHSVKTWKRSQEFVERKIMDNVSFIGLKSNQDTKEHKNNKDNQKSKQSRESKEVSLVNNADLFVNSSQDLNSRNKFVSLNKISPTNEAKLNQKDKKVDLLKKNFIKANISNDDDQLLYTYIKVVEHSLGTPFKTKNYYYKKPYTYKNKHLTFDDLLNLLESGISDFD